MNYLDRGKGRFIEIEGMISNMSKFVKLLRLAAVFGMLTVPSVVLSFEAIFSNTWDAKLSSVLGEMGFSNLTEDRAREALDVLGKVEWDDFTERKFFWVVSPIFSGDKTEAPLCFLHLLHSVAKTERDRFWLEMFQLASKGTPYLTQMEDPEQQRLFGIYARSENVELQFKAVRALSLLISKVKDLKSLNLLSSFWVNCVFKYPYYPTPGKRFQIRKNGTGVYDPSEVLLMNTLLSYAEGGNVPYSYLLGHTLMRVPEYTELADELFRLAVDNADNVPNGRLSPLIKFQIARRYINELEDLSAAENRKRKGDGVVWLLELGQAGYEPAKTFLRRSGIRVHPRAQFKSVVGLEYDEAGNNLLAYVEENLRVLNGPSASEAEAEMRRSLITIYGRYATILKNLQNPGFLLTCVESGPCSTSLNFSQPEVDLHVSLLDNYHRFFSPFSGFTPEDGLSLHLSENEQAEFARLRNPWSWGRLHGFFGDENGILGELLDLIIATAPYRNYLFACALGLNLRNRTSEGWSRERGREQLPR